MASTKLVNVTPVNPNTANVREFNPVIFDKTYTFPDGELHLYVDITKIERHASAYQAAILSARGLPRTKEELDELHEIFAHVASFIPGANDDAKRLDRIRVVAQVQYKQLYDRTYADAMLLAAIASKKNIFNDDPTPYVEEDYDDDDLPGMIRLFRPSRDLNDPAERRLKQFYDFVSKDPTQFITMQKDFESALLAVNLALRGVNTDGSGFRS